jgi:predicted HAD superfamily phosphohydrolase YqeG
MAWRHRFMLRQYNQSAALQVEELVGLDVLDLKAQGIRVLVLDFDGVLAAHGEQVPISGLFDWLKNCVQVFGPGRVFILSNKPTDIRSKFFAECFPGIVFMPIQKKKPYPDGLLQVINKTKVQANEVLMVDDRLLTGILAAILAGVKGRFLTRPMMNFRKSPIIESLFWCLRKGERWFF